MSPAVVALMWTMLLAGFALGWLMCRYVRSMRRD